MKVTIHVFKPNVILPRPNRGLIFFVKGLSFSGMFRNGVFQYIDEEGNVMSSFDSEDVSLWLYEDSLANL